MPVEYIPKPINANIRDETAARAFGVLYTNAQNRPMAILVTLIHNVTAPAQACLAQLNVNGLSHNFSGHFVSGVAEQIYGEVVGWIPPNGTYRITTNITAPATITTVRWLEVDL